MLALQQSFPVPGASSRSGAVVGGRNHDQRYPSLAIHTTDPGQFVPDGR